MNNENIKEILDFKENADYKKLSCDEIKVLRDYITNLQQEKEDYKSRIEKAIKYIKENAWYMNKDDEEILDRVGIEGLLDILNGGNNE